jgi:hypothetical protein
MLTSPGLRLAPTRSISCLSTLAWLVSQAFLFAQTSAAASGSLPSFDFADDAGRIGWQPAHDLSSLAPEPDGLRVNIGGPDPYLVGPPRDYPVGRLLWLRLRLKSDQGGGAQVFYWKGAPSEEQSVRFTVPAGAWHDVRVPVPALEPGYRLRIDPPGDRGTCLLARLWFEERVSYPAPTWPKPEPPVLGNNAIQIRSGELALAHNRRQVGGFRLQVAGREVAVGNTSALAGYSVSNEVRWVSFGNAAGSSIKVRRAGKGLSVVASWADPDGARWNLSQSFTPTATDAIAFETSVMVDQDRAVVYLPLVTLLSGVGTHGTNKHQALLAGVEYLENEPSSSEADLIGPASWRLVPDTLKLTFPLMALQADQRYVGLCWEPQAAIAALYDSPDRQFHSGGHLMGLLFPGSDGMNREERSLLPYTTQTLRAGEALRLRATLLGGTGSTVLPAVQQYVQRAGLPPLPDHGYTAAQYYELAARGWLESRIRETSLYRHAYWPGFNAQPAADAALWMRWLARQPGASTLADELTQAAADALSRVSPAAFNGSQISHVRYPLPALVFGSVLENAEQARQQGAALLNRFQADGSVLYQPPPNGVDYGRTHWAREANGLTASVVAALLEAAVFSGDHALIERGLEHLRALDRFRGTVPRGAQTWEIPLHTPDILASAHLVRAYTLGYELTGEPALLEQARYWAWTGVPFVYLSPPTPQPVGPYSTIAVLGATSWQAPVWLGQPVQWCGLVYGDALHRLAPHDPAGPWKRLADGIAAAGLQHTWPLTDSERKGLLPDFYLLRAQRSDGPAINPATLLVPAIRLFDGPIPYSFQVFRRHGILVHAPGPLRNPVERDDGVSFSVDPWLPGASRVLIDGVRQPPLLMIDGQPVELTAPHQYQANPGRLVIQLDRPAAVDLQVPLPRPK